MRDWNVTNRNGLDIATKIFRITYEGLKQISSMSFSTSIYSFRITMRGLKRSYRISQDTKDKTVFRITMRDSN